MIASVHIVNCASRDAPRPRRDHRLRQRPAGLPAGPRSAGTAGSRGLRTGLRATPPSGAPSSRRAGPACRSSATSRTVASRRPTSSSCMTPPAAHAEHVRLGARGGPPRRREKPLAMTRADAEALVGWRGARPAAAGGAVRAARPDLPRALDARRGRGARPCPHSAAACTATRASTWARVVPRRPRRAAGRGRDLQPQEPDAAARPGRRGAGGRERRPCRGARSRAPTSTTPGRTSRTRPAPRRRRPLLGRHRPGHPALPAARPRALRHRGHRQPARRRLGFARLRVWRNERGAWEPHDPLDATWLWADGLRELVTALATAARRWPQLDHDLHLLDVLDAARAASRGGGPWRSPPPSRRSTCASPSPRERHHLHDHTRPADEQ